MKDKPNPKEEKEIVQVLPETETAELRVGETEVKLSSCLMSAEQLNQLCFNTWWATKNPGKPVPSYTG